MKDFRLDKEKIRSGFKAPDSYFENLHENIADRLQTPEPKIISIWNSRKIRFVVAAVLVISFGILATLNFLSSEPQLETNAAEIYIADLSRLPDEEIISLLDDSDIAALQLEISLDESTIEEVLSVNPNLEQYLLQ